MLGPGATFREGQREAIEAVVAGRPAGARRPAHGLGQEPRLLDRDAGPPRRGPRPDARSSARCSSLMRNQIAMAERLGLRAATINSGNTRRVGRGRRRRSRPTRSTSCSSRPERLANERLRDRHPAQHPGLDRPVRRRRGALHLATGATTSGRTTGGSGGSCASLDRACPVLATTATANDRVVADVVEQLGRRRRRSSAGRWRATRSGSTRSRSRDQAERLAWLAEQPAASCPAAASSTA